MTEEVINIQDGPCGKCEHRGNLQKCLNTPCQFHSSWLVQTLLMLVPDSDKLKGKEGRPENLMEHVDDFVALNFCEHQYARWMLCHFRLSAALKMDFDPFMRHHRLFCTWKGKRYRVTGASRMGDVWLASDFDRETGYDHRVLIHECSEWSNTKDGTEYQEYPEPAYEELRVVLGKLVKHARHDIEMFPDGDPDPELLKDLEEAEGYLK